MELDVLVLGSGVAGLSAVVRLAEVPGMRVGVLTKAELSQSATRWAQGGVAAVLGGEEDSTDLHLADTLAAGAGLCDVDAVRMLVDEGPARVRELIALGAVFDREAGGDLARAREGGHSTARVLHAGGAATGAEVERALVSAVERTAAAVLEQWFALDLLVEGGRCAGVVAVDPDGRVQRGARPARGPGHRAVPASSTPSPPTRSRPPATASPWRCGPGCPWPTSSSSSSIPRPCTIRPCPDRCLSEALRGHGALLRDASGERFVDELAPRDVVSRAMAERMAGGRGPPPVARRHRPRGVRRALPHPGRTPVGRRARPGASTGCPSRRPPTTSRAVSSPTSTGPAPCPDCGRRGRRRAPACTGPTGWRRTPCSRGWCSAPGWPRPSRAGATAPWPPGSCGRSLGERPGGDIGCHGRGRAPGAGLGGSAVVGARPGWPT